MSLLKVFAHLFHPQRSNNHRPRILHPGAVFSLTIIALGFFGLIRSPFLNLTRFGYVLGYASSITPSQVIERTNAERAKVGLTPLVENSKLAKAALAKGQDMFANQYWAHISPKGKEPWAFMNENGYSYRVAGENLAKDFGDSTNMVAAWMNSPTHRANIVNNRYQEIGIAVVDGILSGHETTLVVQMFGTPQVAPSVEAGGVKTTTPVTGRVPAPATIETSSFVDSSLSVLDPGPSVLAGALIPSGSLTLPPLFSVLQLTKATFLGLIMMIVLTLAYDAFVIGNYRTARLVGKNLAHLIFLTGVMFLLIFFKGGIVG